MAAIRPGGKEPGVWALPKGIIGDGEKPEETALREAAEETGVEARLVGKLGDIRYVYTWAGERVFKVVSFYLLRYSRGRLGDLPPATAHEVAETRKAGRSGTSEGDSRVLWSRQYESEQSRSRHFLAR